MSDRPSTVDVLVGFFGERRAAPPLPTEPSLSPEQAAFVAQACRRSGVAWLRRIGQGRPRPVWFAWDGEALLVVVGPGEQEVPGLTGVAEVVIPAKETRARLAVFMARVDEPAPGSAAWQQAAQALALARLNAADPAEQLERWQRSCRVLRLLPLALLAAGPGGSAEPSGADAPSAGSPRSRVRRPWHLGNRRRRAARLSAWPDAGS